MAEVITNERIVLLENTLQANKEVIAENEKLRQHLKTKEEEHNQLLFDVLKELQDLKEDKRSRAGGRGQTRKKQKVQVPPACRVSPLCFFLE